MLDEILGEDAMSPSTVRLIPSPVAIRCFIAVLLPLVALLPARAQSTRDQQEPPAASLHVEVNEVQVSCVAQDSHTAPIRALTKDDFLISVDGSPVPLRALGTDADVPIGVSLLIDVSLSQKGMARYYADAVRGLKQQLRPGRDKVNVYTFAGAVRLYRDWEDVASLTVEEIENIDPNAGVTLQKNPPYQHGGTRLFDAVVNASGNAGHVQGRRAILVLTDGVDEGSNATSGTGLKTAEQGNVSISALEFDPEPLAFLSPAFYETRMHDSLSAISNASGGVFLHAKRGEEKDQIETILRLLKQEYILYFAPPQVAPGPHQLLINLAHPLLQASLRYRRRIWIAASNSSPKN